MKTKHDEKTDAVVRDIGRAINRIRTVVYSHHELPLSWHNSEVHVVADDNALVADVQRLKRETKGTIMLYGGVRLARSFVQRNLPDEIHLVICPVILGAGQPLFTDLVSRRQLRLREAKTYDSGATAMQYEMVKGA